MHFEHERGGVGCDLGGKGEGVLDVLLGEDGHACGNPAYQGKRYRTAVRRLLDLCKAYGTTVLIEQLERTGLRGVAFDEAARFEGAQVRMDRGGGGEPHGGRHLAHARRITLLLLVRTNVVVDLLLALRNLACHRCSLHTKHLFDFYLTGTTVRR